MKNEHGQTLIDVTHAGLTVRLPIAKKTPEAFVTDRDKDTGIRAIGVRSGLCDIECYDCTGRLKYKGFGSWQRSNGDLIQKGVRIRVRAGVWIQKYSDLRHRRVDRALNVMAQLDRENGLYIFHYDNDIWFVDEGEL